MTTDNLNSQINPNNTFHKKFHSKAMAGEPLYYNLADPECQEEVNSNEPMTSEDIKSLLEELGNYGESLFNVGVERPTGSGDTRNALAYRIDQEKLFWTFIGAKKYIKQGGTAAFYHIVKAMYPKLAFSLWDTTWVINDKQVFLTKLIGKLCTKFMLSAKYYTQEVIAHFKANEDEFAFDPGKQYCLKLKELGTELTQEDYDNFNTAASKIFGVPEDDDLSQLYFSKWLMGGVARLYQPGTKMDNVLVLQGKQELGKTLFFEAIAPMGKATGFKAKQSADDQTRLMAKNVILDMGEISGIMNARDTDEFKDFITTTHDDRRPLYSEEIYSYPRHCIFGGTVNNSEFLNDPTGSRRFWVIEVPDTINLEFVKENRDRLWAVAYQKAIINQEQHWLTKAESARSAVRNREYQVTDAVIEDITLFLELLEAKKPNSAFRSADLYKAVLELPTANVPKTISTRVATALRNQQYKKSQRVIGGKKVDCYAKEGLAPGTLTLLTLTDCIHTWSWKTSHSK